MPRSYARITTQMWRDPDFRALTPRAQWLYFLLMTQSDISAAGVLPLTVRRWSSLSHDADQRTVTTALTELAEHEFVVVDDDTEELLIRSFVRWDGGANNSKRRPVIRDAAREVDSPALQRTLAVEFERLGLPIDWLPDAASDRASGRASTDVVEPAVQEWEQPDAASAHIDHAETFSQVDSPSDGRPDAASGFGRVGERSPQPPTRNPVPPSAAREPMGTQAIVGSWIDGCRKRPPKNVIGQVSRHVKAMLEEGIDPQDVQAGLGEWARKGNLHPSTLPSLVNEVMNRGPSSSSFQSQTDANIASLLGTGTDGPTLYALPGGEA